MMAFSGNPIKQGLALLPLLVLGGCATTPPPHDSYRPTLPRAYISEESANGSIYQSARDVRLFEDVKARRVGDIITVVLQESTPSLLQQRLIKPRRR